MAVHASAADVHLYGIDCGNGALGPVVDLPYCGAVVMRTEPERAARLLRRLGWEVERRQDLLALGGYASVTEQRAAVGEEERLPHIIVLLDRWEGLSRRWGRPGAGS